MTLAVALRDELHLEAAVETGTFLGDSAAGLAEHFRQVWTIELAEPLWREAMTRHGSRTNITFLQGRSEEHLPALDLPGPTLYWLDGHWSVGPTAGADKQCPVLDEIRAIDKSPHAATAAILIDDARQFFAPPGPPLDRDQWPPIMEVADLLRAQHDRYVTVLEDVVVAVPMSARRVVEDYGMSVAWTAPAPSLAARIIGRARREITERTKRS